MRDVTKEIAQRPASTMTIREAFTLGALIGLLSEGYATKGDLERSAEYADAAIASLLKGQSNG